MGTRLLVVDDDINICDLLKIYFENEGTVRGCRPSKARCGYSKAQSHSAGR